MFPTNLLHKSVAPVSAVVLSGVTLFWTQMEILTWMTRWTWLAMWRSFSAGRWRTSGAVSSPESAQHLQVPLYNLPNRHPPTEMLKNVMEIISILFPTQM